MAGPWERYRIADEVDTGAGAEPWKKYAEGQAETTTTSTPTPTPTPRPVERIGSPEFFEQEKAAQKAKEPATDKGLLQSAWDTVSDLSWLRGNVQQTPVQKSVAEATTTGSGIKQLLYGKPGETETLLSRMTEPKPSPDIAALETRPDWRKTQLLDTSVFSPERGIQRGITNVAGGLTTPENIMLLLTMKRLPFLGPNLGPALQQGASAVFGTQMLSDALLSPMSEENKQNLSANIEAPTQARAQVIPSWVGQSYPDVVTRYMEEEKAKADSPLTKAYDTATGLLTTALSPAGREGLTERYIGSKMGAGAFRHGFETKAKVRGREEAEEILKEFGSGNDQVESLKLEQPVQPQVQTQPTPTPKPELTPKPSPQPTPKPDLQSEINRLRSENERMRKGEGLDLELDVEPPPANLPPSRVKTQAESVLGKVESTPTPTVEIKPEPTSPPVPIEQPTPKTITKTKKATAKSNPLAEATTLTDRPVSERATPVKLKPKLNKVEDITRSDDTTPAQRGDDIFLGSGFGSLQSLYEKAVTGLQSPNAQKAIRKAVQVIRAKGYDIEQATGDYAIRLRALDELANINFADGKTLDNSAYVAVRMHAGTMGAALAGLERLNVLRNNQYKELKAFADTVNKSVPRSQRLRTNDLFRESLQWASLRTLTTDIPRWLERETAKWQEQVDAITKDSKLSDSTKERLLTDLAKSKPEYINPGGKTTEELLAQKSEMEANAGPELTAKYERMANELRDYHWEQLHEVLVTPYWAPHQKGVMSEAQFQAMKEASPNWTPLRREFEKMAEGMEQDNPFAAMLGGQFNVPSNTVVKSRKRGSERELADPILEMNRELVKAYNIASRNSAAMKLADLRLRSEAMGDYIKKVGSKYTPGKNEHKFSIIRDGKVERYVVHRQIAPILTRMDRITLDSMTEAVSKLNNLYRNFITATPGFMATNIPRDFVTAFTTSVHDLGYIQGPIKYMQAMMMALTRSLGVEESKKAYENYTRHFAGGSSVREYLTKGDKRGATTEKLLDEMAGFSGRGIGGKLSTAVKAPWEAWKYTGESLELGPRFMAMRNALEKGESPYIAAYRARNITQDYAIHGMNEKVNQLRHWVPFVNARHQANRNVLWTLYEVAKGTKPGAAVAERTGLSPSRATPAQKRHFIMSLSLMGLAAAWSQFHNLLLYPEAYADINDDVKNDNLMWLDGNKDEYGRYTGFRLPSKDWAWFIEPIRYAVTWAAHNDPKMFFAIGKSIYGDTLIPPRVQNKPNATETLINMGSSITPISWAQGGKFSTREVLSNIIPPVGQGLIEGTTGFRIRSGRSVAGRTMKAEPWARVDESVTPSEMLLSKGVNKVADVLGADKQMEIRSPKAVHNEVERLGLGLIRGVADAGFRSANTIAEWQGKDPLFRDPAAEMGLEPEGLFAKAKARFTTATPRRTNEQEERALELKQQRGNISLSLDNFAKQLRNTVKADEKAQAEDPNYTPKAPEEIRNFLTQLADPTTGELDRNMVNELERKYEAEVKKDVINARIDEYNLLNRDHMSSYGDKDIRMAREPIQVRAQLLIEELEKLKDFPQAQERFITEWVLKEIYNDKVEKEAQKILQRKAQANQTPLQ